MLGWHVTFYRQSSPSRYPAPADATKGEKLAVYQTGDGGMGWLHKLAESGDAVCYVGSGYPNHFTVRTAVARAPLLNGPPNARKVWGREEFDTVLDGWLGQTWMDVDAIGRCSDDEWLLVEAWDES